LDKRNCTMKGMKMKQIFKNYLLYTAVVIPFGIIYALMRILGAPHWTLLPTLIIACPIAYTIANKFYPLD